MKWNSRLPAALALMLSVPALAADNPPATTPGTTVKVQGTRATFEVPPGTVERAEKPDFQLKLPPYNLNSVDYNFPSGLRVIFQADHSQPVVAITTVVDRGSTNDPIGKEGIAHFVEHMWFRSEHPDLSDPTGVKRLPKTWDILSELGCDLNASTSDDWTNYMSVCPSTSLPSLLRLESLRMTNAIDGVKPAVVDTEREVIRNELRMRYENDNFSQVLPYLFDRLYPDGHPYERLGIGSHESLANCTLPDIQKFVFDNYIPSNTTIVIVGDFDIADAGKLIAENFDPKLLVDPKNPTAPLKLIDEKDVPPRVSGPAKEPPAPKDQTMGTFEAAVEDPMVVLGWTVPGGYRGQDSIYQLTAGVAGNYIAAYFRENDSRVKANEVGCFLWESKIDSKVICAIPLKTSDVNPDQIAQRAADQVAFMWDADYNYDPVNNIRYVDVQLSRYKQENLAGILRSLDLYATVGGGRATDIAHHAHFTGSAAYHTDAMNDTMSVNGTAITDTAYKYLRRERMVNVFLKPIPEDELVMDAASNTTYIAATGDDGVLRSTIDPKSITAEVIRDFTITPDLSSIIDKTLPNGMRLVVLPHGEAPLVEVGLYTHGGTKTSAIKGMDEFAEQFATTSWNDTARNTDPLRIAGTWGQTEGDDYTYHYVQSSSGNLDGGLWLLREAMEDFKVNLEGRADYVKDGKAYLKRQWKIRSTFVDMAGGTARYGTNPYAESLSPWEDYVAMSSFTAAQASAYIHEKYQPANSTLVIVGNVDGAQAEKLAEYYMQGWKPAEGVKVGREPAMPPQAPSTAAPQILLFDAPGKTQTEVTYNCPITNSTPTTDAPRQILQEYLNEAAWIVLRENGGVTYGAGAYTMAYPNGSAALIMNSLVQNDGTTLAIEAFQGLAQQATDGIFKDDRIQVFKLDRAKKYVLAQQSVPQMRSRLMGPLIWEQPWSWMDGYADRLAAVDAKAMQAQMGDCTKHFTITVEGPKDALIPALDAAKISYKLVDWKQEGKDLYAKYDPKGFAKSEKASAKAKAKEEKQKAKKGMPSPTETKPTDTAPAAPKPETTPVDVPPAPAPVEPSPAPAPDPAPAPK